MTLALDLGRLLSVLRFGVAAGWLTESEAVVAAKPMMTRLLNAYASWEDYASHYAFGRVFYAISDGKDYDKYLKDVLQCIKKYDIEVSEDKQKNIFTYHNIKFPGEKRNNSKILKYDDVVYTPSRKTDPWILVVKAENNIKGISLKENVALNSFLKQNMWRR